MELIQVRCPKCGKRVMDVSDDTTGTIVTVCRRCGNMISYKRTSSDSKASAPSL